MLHMFSRLGSTATRRGFQTACTLRTPYPYKLIRSSASAAAAPPAAAKPVTALQFTTGDGGIIGWIAGDAQAPIRPQNFVENRQFWPLVEEVLAQHAHEDPELQAQAAFQKTGWMNIADGRNPPPLGRTGNAEDILGCVLIEDKTIKPGSFQPNCAHRPVSSDGLFQLPSFLHARLLERLS
ncbi:hypothetical protein IWW50_004654 [Coemansia erecta]|nr:hypothetical protein GGF43_000246 [Coemansia sp. RSA 2618]KAJ2821389.1 hypothetical protein IWW50_004654 [Coemansia erecta]